MSPQEIAAALVDKWRREFGVLCADTLRADIAAAIQEDRRERAARRVHWSVAHKADCALLSYRRTADSVCSCQ